MGQLDEAAIILDQLVRIERGQAFGLNQQVLLDLIANHFRQNQFADARSTQRQCGLIETPRRNYPSGQDIRIQEKADSSGDAHFPRRWRRRKTLRDAVLPKRRV